jgi:GT2 family glycosyltransferase
MELSVVIISFNVREYLRRCLASVQEAAGDIDHEILVVDNFSEDGSADMVNDEFPDVKLIRNNVNAGYSVANNQAIRESEGEFILLLNPDTIVEKDAFSKCIGFMIEHEDAGAMGVKMISGKGDFLPESKRALPSPLTAFFKVTGLSSLFPRSVLLNRYYLPDIGIDDVARIEVVAGAYMFIRKNILLKTGLLDEDYFMYGEDIELSYNLLRAGYHNYYFPEVSIIHFKGKSTSLEDYDDLHHFYRAMSIYAGKRYRERFYLSYFIIIPAITVIKGLAVLVRFLKILEHKLHF